MNWGFVGFGRIARKFLHDLQIIEGEKVGAIASRSNAEALRKDFPDTAIYSSYEELLSDPTIDVVYISTTHNFHKQNVIDSLKAGKHVLCEKPMGLTEEEVHQMTVVAHEEKRFLMEALWTRFLPGYQKAKEIVESGEIGELRVIKSDFTFTDVSQKSRLYDPSLAGGSNYDINIYNLHVVHDFFGAEVPAMTVQAKKSNEGTDVACSSILHYPNNRMAQLFSSLELTGDNVALLLGQSGWLRMIYHWKCERFEIYKYGEIEVFEIPFRGNGYTHEIEEVVRCISNGLVESPRMTLQHSLELTRLTERTENLIRSY